jgi:endonuclease YncB( thermonuclease family)
MKIVFVAALLLAALSAIADTIEGKVISVADGDTITVLDSEKVQHKIRLAGIDAPEKKQPFGNRSKEYLSGLVFGKNVTVETNKRDKYQRSVGKVLVDGVDANLEQIKRGMAWHYKAYEREQSGSDRQAYSDAENEARSVCGLMWNPCLLGSSGMANKGC